MILSNCVVFDGVDFKEGLQNIYIENALITDIRTYTHEPHSININGCIAVPGFIDIHTHGICGTDFSYSFDADADKFFDNYVKVGTTSVFPTTVTMDPDKLNLLLSKYSKIKHPAFCGIHLEGPFINIKKAG